MDHCTPLVRSLLLRLPLLLLLYCVPARAASSVAAHAPSNVTGFLGESTILVCNLTYIENETTVTQLTLMKKNSDGSRSTVAVLHPNKGSSITDPERVKFLTFKLDRDSWHTSLAMSHLRAEDEGVYECQFATFPTGSRSAHVWLQVLAQPTVTAEALEPSPTLQLQEVAVCTATGGRPPPQIHWPSNPNGSVIRETPEPGPQPGTFTVTSIVSLVPSSQANGKSITCQVDHITFQKPDLRNVTLSLPYPPEVSISGYDNNWYEGRTKVALTCEAHSKPEPTSYEWSTTTGPLPNTTKAQGHRLLISTVDRNTLNNVTFICNVTNALGSGQGQRLVQVKGDSVQPSSGLSTGVIVGICIAIIIIIGIFVSITLWCKCRSTQSRTSEKKEYSPVINGNCAQDIEMNGLRLRPSPYLPTALILALWLPQGSQAALHIQKIPEQPQKNQDLLLSLHGVPSTVQDFIWYLGEETNGGTRLFSYIPGLPRPQRDGNAIGQRDIVGFPNGSMLLRGAQPSDSGTYQVAITINPSWTMKAKTEVQVPDGGTEAQWGYHLPGLEN
ncbi:hypothetical protein STEG23_027669 [Scotinomys teguina]